MNEFTRFMKENKTVRKNTTYVATKSLTDETGKPLEWTIRPLTSKEVENIKEKCVFDEPVKGKPGRITQKLNNILYNKKIACASVVYPDLHNKALQDSYGVMTPEDLIQELIDNPVEFANFIQFINDVNELEVSLDEKVTEAKN